MRTSKKLLIGAVLAVTFLIGVGTPASALGPFTSEIQGGTLDTAVGQFSLVPGSQGLPPCVDGSGNPFDPSKPDNLYFYTDADAAPTAGPGRWSVNGLKAPAPPTTNPVATFTTFFRLGTPPSGPWYQADFQVRADGTYALTAPNTYNLTGTLTFSVRIYELNTATPLCPKNTLRCIVNGRFGITTGTYNGTLPASAVGDTAVINASTAAAGGLSLVTASCVAPFTALNGTTATLTGLTLGRI